MQDDEDLENSTVDKIRRVMHLVYSMAQANDLIPRTVEANPVTHVHIATTTEYEAILVTPQQAWNVINRMQAFARLLTLLIAVTGLRIGEVLALRWKHVEWCTSPISSGAGLENQSQPPRRSLSCYIRLSWAC